MRSLLAVGSVLALLGLVAGSAGAGQTVPATVKFESVYTFSDSKGDSAVVAGSIGSKVKACKSKTRRLTLFDADSKRKLGSAPASIGYWSVHTAELEVGDHLFAKLVSAKATEKGKTVSCAAVKSSVYTVKKLQKGVEG